MGGGGGGGDRQSDVAGLNLKCLCRLSPSTRCLSLYHHRRESEHNRPESVALAHDTKVFYDHKMFYLTVQVQMKRKCYLSRTELKEFEQSKDL